MLSMNLVEKSLVVAGLCVVAQIASAQTWTQTSAPSNNWASVASSADGSKLVAAASTGLIYVSTNSGANWTFTSAPVGNWYSVSSSADGTKLAAVANNGPICISADSGTDWTLSDAPTNLWTSVASAADGNKLIAVAAVAASTNSIYTSVNSGTNWTKQTGTFTDIISPFSIASSADGSRVVVVAYNVHYSINSGTNWAQTSAPLTLSTAAVFPSQVIASSADGAKWVAAETFSGSANPAPIYTTTNSGGNWTLTAAPSNYWSCVAMSADGSKIVAASSLVNFFPTNVPGPIYVSTNFGVNWTAANAPSTNWVSVASSADGNQMVAAVRNGGIWISQTTPSPQLNFAPTNGNFKISWLIPSTNFVMQQSSNLASWSNMTNPPVLNLTNLQNEVILAPTNGTGFFRLKTP